MGATGASAEGQGQKVVERPASESLEVLVRFRPGVDAGERASVRRAHGVRFTERLPLRGLEVVSSGSGQAAAAVAARLARDPDVVYAEPNQLYHLTAMPNDPSFPELWGLHSPTTNVDVDAPEAWEVSTGSSAIRVAVVDTGIAYDHPDLAPNMWVNPGESGGSKATNGIDDDGNGFVDDVHGWDWVNDDRQPYDVDAHGTHVAGTIGASGNNGVGVVGVNWDVSLMALRAGDGSGLWTDDVVRAFAYAGEQGAKVVNASFGGPSSLGLLDAVNSIPDTLVVAAAGNGGIDGVGDDNDAGAMYPCNLALPNVVCVAATDEEDALTAFSNFGGTTVHLAAPGTGILSTVPTTHNPTGYAVGAGTSMAAPHVSGAAALALAIHPDLRPLELRRAIFERVDLVDALASTTVTGGRLNVAGVAAWAASPPPLDRTAPTNPTLTSPSHATSTWSKTKTVTVDFTGATDPSGVDGFSYAWTTSPTTSPDASTDTESTTSRTTSPSLADGSSWYFHLRTRDNVGNWSAPVHLGPFYVDATAPAAPAVAPLARFQLARTFDIAWSATDATGVVSHDVSYEATSYTAYTGTTVAWKTAAGGGGDSFTGRPGVTYCFWTRARDAAGNVSVSSARVCTAVPADNPAFSHGAGWAKKTGAGYYLGTYSLAKNKNATLTRTGAQGKHFVLVATRCPGCGTVRVYWDVGLSRSINLAASSVRKRQVIPIVSFDFVRTANIRVVVASSGKPVHIDGLGVSRS